MAFGPNNIVHQAGEHPITVSDVQVGDKLLVLNGFATVKAIFVILGPTEVVVFESGLELTGSQLVFHNFKCVQAKDLPGVIAIKIVDCSFKLVLQTDNRLSKFLLVNDRECLTDELLHYDGMFKDICGFFMYTDCMLGIISNEF